MAEESIDTVPDFPTQELSVISTSFQIPTRSEVEQEFADYEDEVIALEDLLIKLKHKRYALLEKLNRTTAWLTVLSSDIAIEIFAIVCQNQDKANCGELPAPFILGAVCKSWRSIIWSTPRLWSILKICFVEARFDRQEDLVREWILRSGDYPLHLYLDAKLTPQWEPTQEVFTTLLDSSSRWISINTFVFHGLALAMQEDDEERYSFPRLQSVRLHGNRQNCPPSVARLVFIFNQAQLLRTFCDDGASLGYTFLVKYAALENLVIKLDRKRYLGLFRDIPVLQSLRLQLVDRGLGWTTPDIPLPRVVRKLRHLSIEGLAEDVSQCLRSLTTPKLTTLEVGVMSGSADTGWLQTVVDLQERSSCRLTSLSLKDGYIPSEAACVVMWDSLPTLERLSLDSLRGFLLSDLMITKLNPSECTEDENLLLPKLREFIYKGDIAFRPTSLTAMLKKRLQASQDDSPETRPPCDAIHLVDITYWNREWGHSDGSDPNVLRDFYYEISSLLPLGLTMSIAWQDKIIVL